MAKEISNVKSASRLVTLQDEIMALLILDDANTRGPSLLQHLLLHKRIWVNLWNSPNFWMETRYFFSPNAVKLTLFFVRVVEEAVRHSRMDVSPRGQILIIQI